MVKFIEEYCYITDGPRYGQPVKLAPFQRAFIEAIYDNPHRTRRAILSTARKNSKTTTIACLLLNHLCGPSARNRPNAQLYSCAQSRDQAAIVFSIASKMVRMNPALASAVRIKESAKELMCPELGTVYKALSSESTTALGLNPQLTIFDELGSVVGPRSPLYEAMESATAALEDPITIIISTQAPGDGDLFSILIDDAMNGNDPQTVVKLHCAPPDLDPFSEAAIRAANPAIDHFMNKSEILAMAANAKRMPARAAEFKNRNLNMRVSASSPFIEKSLWDACSGEPMDFGGLSCFGGLDLSESGDLTAFVLIYNDINGMWHVKPTFWLPEERLMDRAAADRAPYDQWAPEGFLETTPGASISYEWIADWLKGVFEEYDVRKLAFDRWGFDTFRQWLGKVGFPEAVIKERFVPFGQGYRSMSPALRDLESMILERRLRHGGHPVLNMCMANATVERDHAGNRKLSKLKSSGRIDGAVALAMAVGAAPGGWTGPIDVAALIG